MKLKYQAALLTLALSLGSCSSDELFGDGNTAAGATGRVNKPGVEVNNAEKVISNGANKVQSRAQYDVSNYLLDFYRDGEATPCVSYVYKEMPSAVELPAGDYTVSVRSHNVAKSEWDNPYFTGTSEQFTVTAGEITTVTPVKCVFSSLKVTVKFGDKLREVMGDDVQVTVVANDEGKLTYTPSETRAGYFEALEGSVSLAATFTGMVNGHAESFSNAFGDVAKGQHRIITYEVGGTLPEPPTPGGTIDLGNGLTVDFSYTDETLDGTVDPGTEEVDDNGEKEPGQLPDIDDPDDPDNPDNPDNPDDPKDEAITFGGTLLNGGTYTNTELDDYTVVITSKNPITDLLVNIDSTSLTPEELEAVGLAADFSLAYPEPYLDGILSLGFPCGDGTLTNQGDPVPAVLGATNVSISVTSFMPLLQILGESTSKFTMTVQDGTVTQELKFTILVK